MAAPAYTAEDRLAFKRKDYLTLYETLYKANASLLAATIANPHGKEMLGDISEHIEKVLTTTKNDVERIWNFSRAALKAEEERIKKEPPF